ncbi:putative hydrolase of the HAD superfamily [Tumebacillus sp. BK434]|uniref:HAD family hydrolase n=1 Tax=Tumebacillus sp. BK434 TaxID=2512169 RepID=UPI00104429F5|nr:HAD family hydrolase [Tumebacillus sp. BK434]TCP59394.1 putative hydrolase of the HAD superfamily [Tumebacillus sp. BK434]
MIRGILFDLDETLLDRSASLKRFLQDQYARYRPYFQAIPYRQFEARFLELDERGYVHKSVVYSQLIAEWSVKGLTSDQLLHDYRIGFAKHSTAFPDLHELLTNLRANNYKLGIVTNGETLFQQQNIEALGLPRLVDTILISEHEQLRKPDPAIFYRAAQRLGLSPKECLFVGDHPSNDIAGARNAGMSTAWFSNGISWPENLPPADLNIQQLRELQHHL